MLKLKINFLERDISKFQCVICQVLFIATYIIPLYGDCLIMSRTKTNQRTDREQYTRSNAATARLLTLVKPVET